MSIQIEDGAGNEYRAEVSAKNRLFTDSVSRSQLEYACLVGNAYNISTGSITLTSDSQSAVGYFKYTGDNTIVIKEILIILGDSNGTGNGLITLVKNPSQGTIVSNAVPVNAASNRDFSSANLLNADAFKGVEGDTLTDGATFAVTSRNATAQIVAFDAAPIVLKRGNSIGILYTPPSGNTSQSVIVAGTVFEELTNIR